jgi:DNA-binding transcriptional ArsR family regulator
MPNTLSILETLEPICCPPLGKTSQISEADANDLAVRLKALADPARLQLVSFLLDQDDQEACTCDLAPFLSLSEPTVSHHLKKLEAAGIVQKERRGMNVYYKVIPESIHAIARVLHLECC